MTIEQLQAAAASNTWSTIAPEIGLGVLALLLLVLEIVFPKKKHALIPTIAIIGQLGILLGLLINFSPAYLGSTSFNSLLQHSETGQYLRAFFLVCSILVSLLGVVALAKQRMPRIEFFHIVMVVTGAMMLLAQSANFLLLFVALETVTVGFYILVSYTRTNPLSLEAGLKYLVTGALSSALLLFGIVLLYGVAGNPAALGSTDNPMGYFGVRQFLAANPGDFLASVGIVLTLAGVAFKIGAVPFQIWIPDVYQGAPTPVTAFLAVASKTAGFAVLLGLVYVFQPYETLVVTTLSIMAGATILFGNLAALTQHNVKRLLGLSGVSHAGYLLLGVIATLSVPDAAGAVWFYLFAYLLASFAVFGVMTHVAGPNDAEQDLDHYADFAKKRPYLAGVLAIGLGSLAGIPPLAGFMGKLLVFMAAFKAGLYPLLAIAVVGVVISIYYYFGWMKAAYFSTWRPPLPEGEPEPAVPASTPVSFPMGLALGALAAASVVFGLYQGPFAAWLLSR
ncbi:MAG: NADH-quinone oxidoreductase subunit N [Opitutaceae bacterium]|jgi:NADH-quinone oxidoreductase subunit N|nr:NADH-quinone oxidoreductase subunit N [Opitutaceae bacterium]